MAGIILGLGLVVITAIVVFVFWEISLMNKRA